VKVLNIEQITGDRFAIVAAVQKDVGQVEKVVGP
jgi:hypothetical protein